MADPEPTPAPDASAETPVIDYTTDATSPGATVPVAEAPDAEPAAAPAVEESVAGFEIKRWNGRPLYQCTTCPFDTLDINEARLHAAPKPVPTQSQRAARAGIVLTDRYGNTREG